MPMHCVYDRLDVAARLYAVQSIHSTVRTQLGAAFVSGVIACAVVPVRLRQTRGHSGGAGRAYDERRVQGHAASEGIRVHGIGSLIIR
jgi:hypothetical protein